MMEETSFWLIRHALVEENARAFLYGVMDVALCETTLLEQAPMYRSLATRLPRPADWLVTPLSRTRRTAETIFAHGYPRADLAVEPDLTEQSLGVAGAGASRVAGQAGASGARVLAAGGRGKTAGRREHGGGDRAGWCGDGAAGGDACRAGRGNCEPWRGDPGGDCSRPAHRAG